MFSESDEWTKKKKGRRGTTPRIFFFLKKRTSRCHSSKCVSKHDVLDSFTFMKKRKKCMFRVSLSLKTLLSLFLLPKKKIFEFQWSNWRWCSSFQRDDRLYEQQVYYQKTFLSKFQKNITWWCCLDEILSFSRVVVLKEWILWSWCRMYRMIDPSHLLLQWR